MYRAVRVIVTGRVQGVRFRDFVQREAVARRLDGWVRNRRDGSVETVLAGENSQVHQMLAALQGGTPMSRVSGVVAEPFAEEVPPGFRVLTTS